LEGSDRFGSLDWIWLSAPQPFLCVHGVLTEFYVCSEKKPGLAWATDEQTLKEAFSSFGEVIEGTDASFPQTHILLFS
jgi:hypothetical protein